MITIATLIDDLKDQEPNAVTRVMAMMSYNPSIGRALEKDGVQKFQSMAVRKAAQLSQISSREQFEKFHDKWIKEFIRTIQKNNQEEQSSVGQAQKAINVFLKLFVDWARRPDLDTAGRLVQYLHVPLDKILMKKIREYFPNFFAEEIRPLRDGDYNYSLSKLYRNEYDVWQKFFRESHPEKPILFDIIWAINRRAGSIA